MKIRMKTLAVGPTTHLLPGNEYDVSKAQGEELVKGGYAERLDGNGAAVKPSAEKKDPAPKDPPKDEEKKDPAKE